MSHSSITGQPKAARKSPAWLSILIVPEGGTPRRYQVKTFWVRMAVAGLTLMIIVILAGAIGYASLFSKAMERDRLQAENARLLKENLKIVELAREVDDSRRSLERIVKSLGGKLELSSPNGGDSL